MEGTNSDSDQQPISPNNMQVIFYLPNQPPASRRSDTPIWERLMNRVGSGIIARRLRIQDCLELFPISSGSTSLDIASNLTTSLSHNKEERAIQTFVLLSLCALLDISGRVAPEEIDNIIKTITKSIKPKYLDTLKRGARVANEIIAEWAERQGSGGDRLQQLDKATQSVLQGGYQSKWFIMA